MPKARLRHQWREFNFDCNEDNPLLYHGFKLKNHSPYFFKLSEEEDDDEIESPFVNSQEQFEAAVSEIWVWMLGERAAKDRALYNSKDEPIGVISKQLPNFVSGDLAWENAKYQWVLSLRHHTHPLSALASHVSSMFSAAFNLSNPAHTEETPFLEVFRATLSDLRLNRHKQIVQDFFQYFAEVLQEIPLTPSHLNDTATLCDLLNLILDRIETATDVEPQALACMIYTLMTDTCKAHPSIKYNVRAKIQDYLPEYRLDALVEYDIASVLVTAYLLEEPDMHPGNWGFSETLQAFVKIDHGRSLIMSTQSFIPELMDIYTDLNFDLHPDDIDSFPNLHHASVYHWPATGHSTLADAQSDYLCQLPKFRFPDIAKLENDSRFINQKFYAMTKFLLLPDEIIALAANLHIDSMVCRNLFVTALKAKKKALFDVLSTHPTYRRFLETHHAPIASSLEVDARDFFSNNKHFRIFQTSEGVSTWLESLRAAITQSVPANSPPLGPAI